MSLKYGKIFIDGQQVDIDLSGGFPFSLVLSIETAEDITKISGTHSKRTVKMPGTSRNAEVFSRFHDPAEDNPEVAVSLPARIEAEGLPVFSGSSRLKNADLGGSAYGLVAKGYNVAFFGNNAEWFPRLQNKSFREFPLPSHQYNEPNIIAGTNADPDSLGYCYTLIKWKSWENIGEVTWQEHTPALFIRDIINAVFLEIGYRVESDFMNGEFFKRLIMPVPLRAYEEDWRLANTDIRVERTDRQGPIGAEVKVDFQIEQDGGDNFDLVTDEYVVPYTGVYDVFGYVITAYRTDPGDPGTEFFGGYEFIRVHINGVYTASTLDLQLNAGDVITFHTQTFNAFYVQYVDYASGSVRFKSSFQYGTPIDFQFLMPSDWLVQDMLKDLTLIFGLMWDTDTAERVVRFEPRDGYSLEAGAAGDDVADGFFIPGETVQLDRKVDVSKGGDLDLYDSSNSRIVMAWQVDDQTAQGMDDELGDLKTYDAQYTYPEGRFEEGESRPETSFFAKTIHLLDSDIRHADSTIDPQIPLIFPTDYRSDQVEAETDYDFLPRLLWFAGRRAGQDGYINRNGTADPYDFPASFMVNYNDTALNDPSLAFSNEQVAGGVSIGLLQKMHLRRLKRLEVGKILTVFARWSTVDIMSFSWRRKAQYANLLWIIRKIDGYKPGSDAAAKTELWKDEIPTAADVDKISSPLADGVLQGGVIVQ